MFETYAEGLFGDLVDGVWIHRGGIVVYANRRAVELLGGSSPDDLRGRCVLELYADADYPSAVGRLQSLAFGQTPTPPQSQRLQRLDGDAVDLELSALCLSTSIGRLVVEVMRPRNGAGSATRSCAVAKRAPEPPLPMRRVQTVRPAAAHDADGKAS